MQTEDSFRTAIQAIRDEFAGLRVERFTAYDAEGEVFGRHADELRICQRCLLELQTRAEQIVTHPQKSRRVKEMELAGVHGMVEQLQREIQAYELARTSSTLSTSSETSCRALRLQNCHP